MSHDRVYAIYRAMLQRCYNPSQKGFHNYGGRGIRVCRRWRGRGGFERFLADMDYPDNPTLTIERKDVNGHYTPANCAWATRKVQSRNRRDTRKVPWQGELRLLLELSEEYGIPYKVLHQRLGRGWSTHRALTQPLRGAP